MSRNHQPREQEQLLRQAQGLHQSGKLAEAAVLYERLLPDRPNDPLLLNCLGLLTIQQNRFEDAVKHLGSALKINKNQSGTLLNLAVAFRRLGRRIEALECYDQAIALRSDFADAHNNRGNILQELKRLEEALASYEQALALKPDFADAHNNRGNVLQELNRLDEALASYDRALSLRPDQDFLLGARLHVKMKLCDWRNFDQLLAGLTEKIQQNHKAAQPFQVLALADSLSLHQKAAEIVARHNYPATDSLGPLPRYPMRDKIRIGYYSADFRNHPLTYLMAGLFEHHDRSRFNLTAFAFGHDSRDEMRQRISAAFDNFVDVRLKSDLEIARLSRDMGIDIAVDLGGFTQDCRTGIFAARAAPIQASYLGYLGTMSAEYIDYLIADRIIIPAEAQPYYSENIIYLPSYQVNDSKRKIAEKAFSREELGLPANAFVFCNFNNNYKITPGMFDVWMRILGQAENSVLFLYASNPWVESNLKAEASLRGIDPERLIFGRHLPQPEYLARYRVADLFLDTLPYNAGTTASDALWAGLPVITCRGKSFASRVAASVLNAIDLPELITATLEEYQTMAVALATRPEQLAAIKLRLERNRLTTPLFDTARFTRHIESAFSAIHERYQSGQPAEHLEIPADC